MIPSLFLTKAGWDRPRKRKKNFIPNSVPAKPCLENSQTNSKKIQRIKKHHSGIISIQIGLRWAEKEWKKFTYQISFLPDLGYKIPKKIVNKFKKLKKHHSNNMSIQTGLR